MIDIPNETENAVKAIESMIERSKKAWGKFPEGSSQHTLQKNRINALNIALSLLKAESSGGENAGTFSKYDIEKATAPIISLISKSEKAQRGLKADSWQYKMLDSNIKALNIALPLLLKEKDNYK